MDKAPPSKGRGCFFYGCIISLVLLLVGGLATFLVARHFIKSMIATYTDSAPKPLPSLEVSQPEIEAVQARCTDFFAKLKTNQPLPPLALSAKEVNTLIAGTGKNAMKDKLRVEIDGNQIKGQMSIPLGQAKLGMLRGRYLNGEFTLKLTWQDGVLGLRPESVMVHGKPLPGWMMNKVRGQDLAQNLMNNIDAANLLQNLESIVVTNDTVVFKPREP